MLRSSQPYLWQSARIEEKAFLDANDIVDDGIYHCAHEAENENNAPNQYPPERNIETSTRTNNLSHSR